MHDSGIDHQPLHKVRRIVASAGIGISIILILGVVAFSVHAAIVPGSSHQTPAPGSPSTIITHPRISCNTPRHQAGDYSASIHSGGLNRTFLIHLPPSYGNQPQPIVINYHGYNNTALRTAQRTNMGAVANKAGFILVFPQGVDNPPSWNAGIGAFGPTGDADDVQFTRDLIKLFTWGRYGISYRLCAQQSNRRIRHRSRRFLSHTRRMQSIASCSIARDSWTS